MVLAVGDNVARGIGLIGALTVIRFRSTLKDPRDLIFAFASLATGVAAGAHAYAAAVLGTVVFLAGTAVAAWLFGPSSASARISQPLPLSLIAGRRPRHRVEWPE